MIVGDLNTSPHINAVLISRTVASGKIHFFSDYLFVYSSQNLEQLSLFDFSLLATMELSFFLFHKLPFVNENF